MRPIAADGSHLKPARLVAAPIWHCHPNELKCQHGHVQVFHRTGFHVDQSRVDGHVWAACDTCAPHTYFFGIIHSRPSPIVHCYSISLEQYKHWVNTPDELADPPLDEGRETVDLLFRLGYNPSFVRRGR